MKSQKTNFNESSQNQSYLPLNVQNGESFDNSNYSDNQGQYNAHNGNFFDQGIGNNIAQTFGCVHKKMKRRKRMSIFTLIVALLLFGIMGYISIKSYYGSLEEYNYKIAQCTATVDGSVTNIRTETKTRTSTESQATSKNSKKRKKRSTKTTTYYIPTISYKVDGQLYSNEAKSSTLSTKYAVGDTVTVKYQPENPDYFYIDGDFNETSKIILYMGYAFFGAGGFFLLFFIVSRMRKI